MSHPLTTAQPDPENHQACAQRLHAARLRLPELRARVEGRISPLARYERDAPNPALTQELTAALRQMIARTPSEPVAAFEVSCRGQHCRISVPSGTSHLMDLVRRIRKEEPLPTRMDQRATSNGAVTYFVSPTPRARGLDFLRARLQEFRASGHPDSCYRQHGMSGSLRVRVVLPTTGELNDDSEKDKISTRYGGDLAATSLGHCIREELDATLAALSLPDPVQGLAWDEVFEFPRP